MTAAGAPGPASRTTPLRMYPTPPAMRIQRGPGASGRRSRGIPSGPARVRRRDCPLSMRHRSDPTSTGPLQPDRRRAPTQEQMRPAEPPHLAFLSGRSTCARKGHTDGLRAQPTPDHLFGLGSCRVLVDDRDLPFHLAAPLASTWLSGCRSGCRRIS